MFFFSYSFSLDLIDFPDILHQTLTNGLYFRIDEKKRKTRRRDRTARIIIMFVVVVFFILGMSCGPCLMSFCFIFYFLLLSGTLPRQRQLMMMMMMPTGVLCVVFVCAQLLLCWRRQWWRRDRNSGRLISTPACLPTNTNHHLSPYFPSPLLASLHVTI